MKKILSLMLGCLMASSCCGPNTSKGRCAVNWIAGATIVGGAALLYDTKQSQKPSKVKADRPDWQMTSRLAGALIAKDRSVYTTHLLRSKPNTVSYQGKEYKVIEVTHINDPRATKGFSMSGTQDSDVTLVIHEPVTEVAPVEIADKAEKGERSIVYTPKTPFISAYIRNVSSSIKLNSGAQHGDSGSPVVDENGRLISFASTSGGEGPNVTKIKNLLLGKE